MNRRDLLAAGAGMTLVGFPLRQALSLPTSDEQNHASDQRTPRDPVLVRSGFTRKSDGTEEPSTSQPILVRSSDSDGRLSVFLVPVGEHQPYRGAPLHVHHAQDEWIHILAGGGKSRKLVATACGSSRAIPC